jgi:hypothetical protein
MQWGIKHLSEACISDAHCYYLILTGIPIPTGISSL